MIKLSVIVTNYNNHEYLEDCLFEISKVHNDLVEVVLIDDCSTDDSVQIANRYMKNIRNFRILTNHRNKGVSFCRNKGISASVGEFFTFVDSDDVIYLERMIEDLNDSLIIDSDWIIYSFSSDKTVFNKKEGTINYKHYSNKGFIRRAFKDKSYYSMVWGKLYKKSVFSNVEFIENVRFEDEAYSLEILISSNKIILIDRPIYFYRRHNNSFMGESLVFRLDYKKVLDLDVVLRHSVSIIENSQLEFQEREILGLYLLKNILFIKFNIYVNKFKTAFDSLTYLNKNFRLIFFYETIINLLPERLFITLYSAILKISSFRLK